MIRRETTAAKRAVLREQFATAEILLSVGVSEALAIARALPDDKRAAFAREVTASVLRLLWDSRAKEAGCSWPVRSNGDKMVAAGQPSLVGRLGDALTAMDDANAGFQVGQLYTALLPDAVRSRLGAYYTPPPLVAQLLDMAQECGVDWATVRVIDPACGGAAFLAATAKRMLAGTSARNPSTILDAIEKRLLGLEVDPFAAWISMVLLDVALLRVSHAAGRPPQPMVRIGDALGVPSEELGRFDLVVGNPPYGKISLDTAMRWRYRESLFGHANLYGLFTDLAMRLVATDGLVAYVTPTSLLGGEYFKKLRSMILSKAPPVRVAFVHDRDGVFADVLQETMLTVMRRHAHPGSCRMDIDLIRSGHALSPAETCRVGTVTLDTRTEAPWLLPRTPQQVPLVDVLNAMPDRLSSFGYSVATGPLVWNRHKQQLRAASRKGYLPIIWAESITADGRFHFQASRRNHLPYIELMPGQDFLMCAEPCILLQRTTAKEQKRRLIAAVIPNSFILAQPGFVVENHLNMIRPIHSNPDVGMQTIAAVLNSRIVDLAFRCISGSVAVSAYELQALPFPSIKQMLRLQRMLASQEPVEAIESEITNFYENQNRRSPIATGHPRRQSRSVAA